MFVRVCVGRSLRACVGGVVGWLTAHGAFAQTDAPFDATAPALALRIDGTSTLGAEELRTELELATGKPVVLSNTAPAGLVVVTFTTDAVGLPHASVVYHPPAAELTRSDALPQNPRHAAHHVALLARGIMQRHAGITVLSVTEDTPQERALGSCAVASDLARPVTLPEPKSCKPRHDRAPKIPMTAEGEPWRAAFGVRWSPAGFGVAAGNLPQIAQNTVFRAIDLDERAWMVGGTLHVDMPTTSRFTFGLEAFAERFAIDGTGSDSDSFGRRLSATYVGAALAPAVRLTPIMFPVEVRLGFGAGFVYSPSLSITSDSDDLTFTPNGVGYRLGGLVTGTVWATASLGVGLALGFDHTFITGESHLMHSEPFDIVSDTTDVWSNQPFLRLSAEYRFQ